MFNIEGISFVVRLVIEFSDEADNSINGSNKRRKAVIVNMRTKECGLMCLWNSLLTISLWVFNSCLAAFFKTWNKINKIVIIKVTIQASMPRIFNGSLSDVKSGLMLSSE